MFWGTSDVSKNKKIIFWEHPIVLEGGTVCILKGNIEKCERYEEDFFLKGFTVVVEQKTFLLKNNSKSSEQKTL